MTLWLILQYYHTKFGDKNVLWFISSGQIFTDIFNLRCDLDHERSNPFFSRRTLLLIMLYHQTEFGCKRTSSVEDVVDIVIF